MKFRTILFFLMFLLNFVYSQNKNAYVIITSFDGFRWDYLQRGLTPNLNKLIKNGVKAKSLKPCFPSKTFPNHTSILTGMHPENHGIISNTFKDFYHNSVYSISDSVEQKNSKWYQGEFFWETAYRNGINTATYFWPGSELNDEYRRANYYKKYNHKENLDTIFLTLKKWLEMPYNLRPHFITLYFHDVDDAGHKFGPNTPEINIAIKKIDSITGCINDIIKNVNLEDSINLIFVSDHGMTEINNKQLIYLEDIIKPENLDIQYSYEMVMINSINKQKIDSVYNILKLNQKNYTVYLKNNIPSRLHFSKNSLIGQIILIPNNGWCIVQNKNKTLKKEKGGTHGYDNNNKDMHGIFIANGPVFKNNLIIPTFQNIHIYPLLCKIFNINPRSNIDGDINILKPILK